MPAMASILRLARTIMTSKSVPCGPAILALLGLVAACGDDGPDGPATPDVDAAVAPDAGQPPSPTLLPIFDEVVFYDGYAMLVDQPVPEGTQRLRNDLFTRRVGEDELAGLAQTLRAEVVIGALCDNYDRIGSVALALVPKDAETYVPEEVSRIELGRFITPFMNKNLQPDQVAYEFEISNVLPVLRDPDLWSQYDPWLELEVFGVPYAANEQVAGCSGRNDVFRGSLTLETDTSAAAQTFDELIPLAYRVAFNNYQKGASDEIGTTKKTIEFTLASATTNAQLVLITSNHGASSGGEEYERRDHLVSVDGEVVLTYKPGRTSCEPFRTFNTQPNGIYGSSPRSDTEWQSFSNWCPGDVIDTRVVELGPLTAGPHTFVIDVPDARFVGGDGNFPLSLYVQTRH
jgi:peptide-N-glycosidase F-like protein